MKVLSLFDGMACGMIAFKELGITPEEYIAYEIDRYAVQTTQFNFPEVQQMGDVFDADFTKHVGIDWLIGGSPCTFWTIAQTKNRETTASGLGWELFSQFVRALHEAKPHYFLYENNKSMSRAIKESICDAFGFEPFEINSALVSAQTRKRYYWVGVRQEDGIYKRAEIEIPKDRNILLKDILETGEPVHVTEDGKSETIKAQYMKTSVMNLVRTGTFGASGVAVNVPPCFIAKESTKKGFTEINAGGCVDLAMMNSKTRRGRNMESKSNCLQTTCSFYEYCGTLDTPIYEVKDGLIHVNGNTYPIKLVDGFYIMRKFTVEECKKLQTVPEWYKFPVSSSQAYKMLGNGWTVEVIKHLIGHTLAKHEGFYICNHCGALAVNWRNDFDCEDIGLSCEGVVRSYHCNNCGAEIEYLIVDRGRDDE